MHSSHLIVVLSNHDAVKQIPPRALKLIARINKYSKEKAKFYQILNPDSSPTSKSSDWLSPKSSPKCAKISYPQKKILATPTANSIPTPSIVSPPPPYSLEGAKPPSPHTNPRFATVALCAPGWRSKRSTAKAVWTNGTNSPKKRDIAPVLRSSLYS